jgi:hypothetical protein
MKFKIPRITASAPKQSVVGEGSWFCHSWRPFVNFQIVMYLFHLGMHPLALNEPLGDGPELLGMLGVQRIGHIASVG